jgi:hypothetical protein
MYVERWCAVRRVPDKIPMSFVPATLFTESTPGSGRDTLRRRPGITATFPNGKAIDNSWIVSYNIYLMLKYACHINVVVRTYVNLIKYLYRYNFKRVDRAMSALGAPGQDGQPAPHGMKLQSLKTSSHVELQKLAGDFMNLRPTCSNPQYKDWMCTWRTKTG